jgi:hypothetical protein
VSSRPAAFTVFRDFIPHHFAGRVARLADEIYPAIRNQFPDHCRDADLCIHEDPHRPEWQHQVREALDYLHNKQEKIVHVRRGVWQFP